MKSALVVRSCRVFFFFLMIRRPPRSTLSSSSAASDVYKRQTQDDIDKPVSVLSGGEQRRMIFGKIILQRANVIAVSYTHLRAHETGRNLVCRLLLEKKKTNN